MSRDNYLRLADVGLSPTLGLAVVHGNPLQARASGLMLYVVLPCVFAVAGAVAGTLMWTPL